MPSKLSFAEMALAAVSNAPKGRGCSLRGIKKYIQDVHDADNPTALKKALTKGLEDDMFVKDKKGAYRLGTKGKECWAKKHGGKDDSFKRSLDDELMEDTELIKWEKKRKNGLELPPRPKCTPARDTKAHRWSMNGGFVDDDDVADLLVCTSFMNAFSVPLGISSFDVSMLRDAIESKEESALLSDIHVSLLRLIIGSLPEDSLEEKRLTYLGGMLNAVTWPEVLRRYVNFWLRYGQYEKIENKFEPFTQEALSDAVTTMTDKTYFHLTEPEKLTLISFLIDDALETLTIIEYIQECKEKIRDLLAEKREEDVEARAEYREIVKRQKRRDRGLDSSSEEESSSSEDESSDEDESEEDKDEERAEDDKPKEDAEAKEEVDDGNASGTASSSSSEESSSSSSEEDSSSDDSEEESEPEPEPPRDIDYGETIYEGDPLDRKAILAHKKFVEEKSKKIRAAHADWVKRTKQKALQKRQRAQQKARMELEEEQNRINRTANIERDYQNKERRRQEAFARAIARPMAAIRAGGGSLGMDRYYNQYYYFPEADGGKLYVLPGSVNDGEGPADAFDVPSETHWGVYEYKEDLDGLLASLHPRGVREGNLLKKLKEPSVYYPLSGKMRSRAVEAAQKLKEEERKRREEARRLKAEKHLDREKLAAEKRAAEEERRKQFLPERATSRRAAAQAAVKNMIGDRLNTTQTVEKQEMSSKAESAARTQKPFLSWRNTSKYKDIDPEDFSFMSSPPSFMPFTVGSLQSNPMGCVKEYIKFMTNVAEAFDVLLTPLDETNYTSRDNMEEAKQEADLPDEKIKMETEKMVHPTNNKQDLVLSDPDQANAEVKMENLRPSPAPSTGCHAHEKHDMDTEPMEVSQSSADHTDPSIVTTEIETNFNGSSVKGLPLPPSELSASSISEVEYDKLREQIESLQTAEEAAEIILRIESVIFNHCEESGCQFNRRRKTAAERALDDVEDSEDDDDEDSHSDGEDSEFEESDDEDYVYSPIGSRFLWDSPKARSVWMKAFHESKGKSNGSFYAVFFQFVDLIFEWAEKYEVDPKNHGNAISNDGQQLHIPSGAKPTRKIVWAKLPGYPWWPALECEPEGNELPFHEKLLFFEDASYCDVPSKNIKEWKGVSDTDKYEELNEPMSLVDRIRFHNAALYAQNYRKLFPYVKMRAPPKRKGVGALSGMSAKRPRPNKPVVKREKSATEIAKSLARKAYYAKFKKEYPTETPVQLNKRASTVWTRMPLEEKESYMKEAMKMGYQMGKLSVTGGPSGSSRPATKNPAPTKSALTIAMGRAVAHIMESLLTSQPELDKRDRRSLALKTWKEMDADSKKPWIDQAVKDGYPSPRAIQEAKRARAKEKAQERKLRKAAEILAPENVAALSVKAGEDLSQFFGMESQDTSLSYDDWKTAPPLSTSTTTETMSSTPGDESRSYDEGVSEALQNGPMWLLTDDATL